MCFEPIEDNSFHSILFKDTSLCHKCFLKFKPKLKRFKIDKIDAYYLYDYDDEIKKDLYQLKGCFDIELANVFLEYLRLYLRLKYFGYVLVPAPSTKSSDEERGFNHVNKIFEPLKLPIKNCITKTEDFKQSDFSFEERKMVKNKLQINNVDLKNKKVLIVDDVYTSGSTVKAIIDLVKTKKPKKIKVLVMSKTIDPHAYTN